MDASEVPTAAAVPLANSDAPAPQARLASRWLWVLVLGPVLLWNCWRAPFFPLDDVSFIVKSAKLSDESSWLAMWKRTEHAFYYYPVTLTSWRIDRTVVAPLLSGLAEPNAWPAAIRLTNLLLHLGAAFFVYAIARRLGATERLAAFMLAAFALHPAACESVCWCVERKTILAGCFGLAAVWVYFGANSVLRYALAALLFTLALLSKPSALGLLPVVCAWEGLGRPRLYARPAQETLYPRGWWHGAALRLAPWVVLAAIATWIGMEQHELNVLPPPGGSIWTALLTDVDILWRYVLNFLWPSGLSGYYAVAAIDSLASARLWLCAAGLALAVGLTLALAQPDARRGVVFGWLWFAGALGPNLNLIGINDLMHDRFAYLAAPGCWLAIGLALQGCGARLAARLPQSQSLSRKLALSGMAALIVFWSATSAMRSELFTGLKPYFEDAVRKEPRSASAQLYLAGYEKAFAYDQETARHAQEAGEARARAITHYEAGLAAVDYDRYLFQARAHADLGQLYFRDERFAEAAAQMEQALKITRGLGHTQAALADAHQVLGQLELRRGDLSEALRHFDEALQQTPANGTLMLMRAQTLLLLQRQFTKAGDTGHAQAALAEARRTLEAISDQDPVSRDAQTLLKSMPSP